MDKQLNILLLEDSVEDTELINMELQKALILFRLKTVATEHDFLRALDNFAPDLILADYTLPSYDGLSALLVVRKTLSKDTPFIFVSGTIGEQKAIETMRRGTTDYVFKENLSKLGPAVKRALREREEQKKRLIAEKNLKRSADQWRTTFDAIDDAICLLNIQGKIIRCNKAMALFLDKPFDKIIGSFCWELVHNTREPIPGCPVPRMMKTRQRETMLLPCGKKTLQVLVDPILDEKGDVFQIVHTISNITERMQVEKSLRESKERFRQIYEHQTVGVAKISLESKIERANNAYCSMIGYQEEELIGKHLSEITHPEILEENLQKQSELNNGERDHYRLEKLFIHKNGEIIHGILNASLVRNSEGKPLYALGCVMDITERKKMEQALYESEEKYRSMMESMKNESYICSPKLRIEYMNPAMIKRVGRDATGENCYKAIYDRDRKCAWCTFDQIEKKKYVEYEIAAPRDNRYYSVSNSPLSHIDGTVSKLTIFHDITEMKNMEENLRQAQKMESIGTLTGGIAHDFNNILGIILGNTELAIEDVPEWSPAHSNLEEIKTASLRAKNIVRQLLSFSRKVEQKMHPIEIARVIKDALKFLRSTIPTTIDVKQDIKVTDETIFADPTQINQIMMNICINASHAMEETGGTFKVSVEKVILDDNSAKEYPKLSSGEHIKIRISDTGPGINPDIIDRIFDPYFTTKEVGKGSGMGLSVVHGIVKNHNGAITVDSNPGKGTTFNILFPKANEKSKGGKKSTKAPLCGNETILFVDDEISIVKMIKKMLERLGYMVETKMNPVEALDLFKSKPDRFDLVITDMTMPKMTGVKLSEKLMGIRTDIPVIICTGHSAIVDEEKAKKLGLAAYIMKPINMLELSQTIRKVLDKKING